LTISFSFPTILLIRGERSFFETLLSSPIRVPCTVKRKTPRTSLHYRVKCRFVGLFFLYYYFYFSKCVSSPQETLQFLNRDKAIKYFVFINPYWLNSSWPINNRTNITKQIHPAIYFRMRSWLIRTSNMFPTFFSEVNLLIERGTVNRFSLPVSIILLPNSWAKLLERFRMFLPQLHEVSLKANSDNECNKENLAEGFLHCF